jgi:hypothetical protein
MRTRTRAASYGASSSSHAAHAGAAHRARRGVALGEEDGALRAGRRPRAGGARLEGGGDLQQLVGGARAAGTSPAASMISTCAGSTRDRAMRSRASSTTRRIAASRPPPAPGPAAAAPGRAAAFAPTGSPGGTPPRPRRTRRAAGGARRAGRRPHRPRARRAAARAIRTPAALPSGVRPRAVQLQDLGAPHQALSAVRHQVRLGLAPVGQRRRPLLRPAEVEDLLAPSITLQ